MKKIVGAVLAATLAAGVATAEVKTSLNYRMQANAFGYDGNTRVTGFKYDGIAADTDSFKFAATSDIAGATMELNFNGSNTDGSKNPTLKQYNGWLKFGKLILQAGLMKDGLANGAFRVKKDVDDGNWNGGEAAEVFKLGTMFKGSKLGNFADDLSNGGKRFFLAEYRDKIDDVSFAVSFNFFEQEYTSNGAGKVMPMGMAARAQLGFKPLDLQLVYKTESVYNHLFALHVMPKIAKGLTMNVGATITTAQKADKVEGNIDGLQGGAFGVDLRLRYANGPLAITLMNNFSAMLQEKKSGTTLVDVGEKINTGIAGTSANDVAGFAKGGWTQSVKVTKAWWTGLLARYKINDTVTALCNAGVIIGMDTSSADTPKALELYPEWRVSPGVQIYAASNASLRVNVEISGSLYKVGDTWYTVGGLDIPLILRVKL